MFKLTSLNLNGIRSAAKKGLEAWLEKAKPDCICVQEIKAQAADVAGNFDTLAGLQGHFHYAEKKGYSGAGIYTPHPIDDLQIGFGNPEFDAEGRYVEISIGSLSVVSVYMPSGSSSPERQEAKFRFLDAFLPHLIKLKQKGRQVVLCGDVNIAHQEIDLKNWKGNLKNSGFLPEERAWLTRLFTKEGYMDVYRHLEPHASDSCYTWWSQRGQAYAKNVGWRIDYQIATPEFGKSAKKAGVYKKQRFSDHAPLMIEYDWAL